MIKTSYESYIVKKIKDFNSLFKSIENNSIYIESFVYNSGYNYLKEYNNRCVVSFRVNKNSRNYIETFLFTKKEILDIISLLNLKKGN